MMNILDVSALNALAWDLATSPNSELRNGRIAVLLAEESVARDERKDWSTLDTLAAAYAECGDFAEAIKIQKESLQLVSSEDSVSRTEATLRLRLYESGIPFRQREPQSR
jgi:hypothetical protein